MKRVVILIDGTWETESSETNISKLGHLIKSRSSAGIEQRIFYYSGVGATPDPVEHFLGGAIGFGLKRIVSGAVDTALMNTDPGDELYLIGFSRGAYCARAAAGALKIPIRCVGVFDTVGSYGIPAGIGLAALARYYTLETLGFHDTSFGDHIDVGLHALAIDEHRRPFVPTFWTCSKDRHPRGHVEQTWFAGSHNNIGGGDPDRGLSDIALCWMIARIEKLCGLEFDHDEVRNSVNPRIGGEVTDSTIGWPIDHEFPHERVVLSPDAIDHGVMFSTKDRTREHINERVHWSVLSKMSGKWPHFDIGPSSYRPASLAGKAINPACYAAVTPLEHELTGYYAVSG